jgi:cytoskeletal protein CcmA (bactofilin family)
MGNPGMLVSAIIDEPAIGSHPESLILDPKAHFEAWLDELKPGTVPAVSLNPPDFIIECNSASGCEIEFAGVLYLEGFLRGDIRSEGGTLVTGPGIVNGNIEVGTAIIGSFGYVNLTASESVLLRGNVIVEGNIRSNSLSIKEGTYFDGHCSFSESGISEAEAPQLLAVEPGGLMTAGIAAD